MYVYYVKNLNAYERPAWVKISNFLFTKALSSYEQKISRVAINNIQNNKKKIYRANQVFLSSFGFVCLVFFVLFYFLGFFCKYTIEAIKVDYTN